MSLPKRKHLKRQRGCVFSKLPEYYDKGLKHRLKHKNVCNSVFNMLVFEFLNAYFEHESNAQCIIFKIYNEFILK